MSWSRRALLVAGLALATGCPATPPDDPWRAELIAPWTTFALPIGEGRVVFCNADMMTVVYPPETADLKTRFTDALVAAGLTRGTDASGRDMVSLTFLEKRWVVALGIATIDGKQVLTLTRSPR